MGEIPRGFRSTINLQKLYRRPSLIALKQLLCISRNLDLIAHHPGFPASSLTSPCCSAERTRFKTRSPFDSSHYCFARSLTNVYRLQQSPSSGSYISHSLSLPGPRLVRSAFRCCTSCRCLPHCSSRKSLACRVRYGDEFSWPCYWLYPLNFFVNMFKPPLCGVPNV